MIQLAVALLVGFIAGWLLLLNRQVPFAAQSAVVLLALMEALSFGWLYWRKQLMEPKRKSVNAPVFWHFVVGCLFGLIVLRFGDSIGEDLRLVATIPIATVFLLNLYKIASNGEKIR
jgi:FtsH-binding integral membrane protein